MHKLLRILLLAGVTPLMFSHPSTLTPEQRKQQQQDIENYFSGGADLHAGNPFASGKHQLRVLPNQNGSVK